MLEKEDWMYAARETSPALQPKLMGIMQPARRQAHETSPATAIRAKAGMTQTRLSCGEEHVSREWGRGKRVTTNHDCVETKPRQRSLNVVGEDQDGDGSEHLVKSVSERRESVRMERTSPKFDPPLISWLQAETPRTRFA